MWYEVRLDPDDMPWIYDELDTAWRKARKVAEKTGEPALVYECSYQVGERLIGWSE